VSFPPAPTTFDLDEYVYDALRAGATGGFLLKDAPPEQPIHAIHTVAMVTRCSHRRSPGA
jgi:DNA-binding NarL/FixJ family response regulator